MTAARKPLPERLSGQLFTRGAAIQSGVTPRMLRGNGVQRLTRAVYAEAGLVLTPAKQLTALIAVLPDGTAVDGVTALRHWGVEVGDERPYRFVTTARYRSERPGVRVRRVAELPERRGNVLAPLAALVAAKTELGLRDLVVAGDWLVRAEQATLPQVQNALCGATGRNCRRARRAGELVRAGSESPRETWLRLLVVLCGLPEPEGNVELGDEWFFIGRVDLYLRAWDIALEYEGDHHRTDATTYGHDLQRYEQLAAAGVLVIRVSKTHLRSPRDVARRIDAALRSRGYDGPAPVFGAEWVSVFGS